MVNDPRFENFLTTRREQAEQQGLVAVAAARPIATGNVVLMRTPQNVVALDWQTGKRIWETREEESSARDQYLAEFMSDNNNGDEFAAMNHPLEQRVWDDTLTMSLSSDGERVFALGGMSLGERDDQSGWNVGPGFGGPFDFTPAPTNRLTAYELATEGKLAWEIDGANASGDLVGRVLPRCAGGRRRLALCARRDSQRHLPTRARTRYRQAPVAAATRRTRARRSRSILSAA